MTGPNSDALADSRQAWLRLGVTLLLMTIGSGAMYVVAVVLPAVQADLLGIPVVRQQVTKTTALSAAYLVGLSPSASRDQAELAAQWQVKRRFLPKITCENVSELMQRCERAVWHACSVLAIVAFGDGTKSITQLNSGAALPPVNA